MEEQDFAAKVFAVMVHSASQVYMGGNEITFPTEVIVNGNTYRFLNITNPETDEDQDTELST
jgi:hypothetical protein